MRSASTHRSSKNVIGSTFSAHRASGLILDVALCGFGLDNRAVLADMWATKHEVKVGSNLTCWHSSLQQGLARYSTQLNMQLYLSHVQVIPLYNPGDSGNNLYSNPERTNIQHSILSMTTT
jgi:hypothetical protein